MSCGTTADLEELFQGLYERELQVFGQAANVVMAFYGVAVLLARARGWTGLDDIWIQGALHQVFGLGNPTLYEGVGKILKVLNELLANGLALQLWV